MSTDVVLNNLDAIEIQKYQQNRYPCFFIDFLEEVVVGKSARGYKNFSFNEWFFPAHFPDEPNVPGFIQVEMLTQVFLMTFLTYPEYKGKKTGFVSIDGANFKKKIVPGNRVDMIATLDSFRHGLAKGSVKGFINDELACQIKLTVTIPDVMLGFIPNGK